MIRLDLTEDELRILKLLLPGKRATFEYSLLEKHFESLEEKVAQADEEPKPDKRRPEVSEVIEHFESRFDLKLPRSQYQRRAASTLIKQHGKDNVIKAIDLAQLARYKEYAPQILSLEDLRDKWNKLGEYFRRQAGAHQDMDIIRSMTRGR